MSLLRRLLVEMEGLRIELAREGDDLVARDTVSARIRPLAPTAKVLEEDSGHGATLAAARSVRRQFANRKCSTSPSGDHVFLAFEPELAGLARAGLAIAAPHSPR